MTRSAFNHAVLSSRLAQNSQPMATYDSKTDQTAQSDQRIGIARKFAAALDQKPTSCHPKLTSGTANQAHSRARGAPSPTDRAQDGTAERVPRQ